MDPVTLSGHRGPALGVAFSPDGTLLVSTGFDRVAIVGNAANGVARARLTGHTDKLAGAAFSPDGALLTTASNDHTIRVWDAATWRREHLADRR